MSNVYRPGDTYRVPIAWESSVTGVSISDFRRNGIATTAPTLSTSATLPQTRFEASFVISSGYDKDDVLTVILAITTASGTTYVTRPAIKLSAAGTGFPVVDDDGNLLAVVSSIVGSSLAAETLLDLMLEYNANGKLKAQTVGVDDGAITAASIAGGALSGKGDWLLASDKPVNFPLLAIGGDGYARVKNDAGATIATASDLTTLLGRIPANTPTILGYIGGTLPLATDLTAAKTDILAAIPSASDNASAVNSLTPPSAFFTNAPTSGGWGSGSGAYVVTVTVTDGASPLQNAAVRLTEGVNSYTATTDAAGVATFSLDAATYTLSITKPGYQFVPDEIDVGGEGNHDAEMSATVIPAPSSPTQVVVYWTALNEHGEPEEGVSFAVLLSSGPGTAGLSHDQSVVIVTSAANGLCTHETLPGVTLLVRRGPTFASNKAVAISVPSNATGTYQANREINGRDE